VAIIRNSFELSGSSIFNGIRFGEDACLALFMEIDFQSDIKVHGLVPIVVVTTFFSPD
jgi:hypothetical protein